MSARKYSDDLIDEAARLREKGMSCAAIAKRLDMSVGAVSWHCLRLGADSPNTTANAPAKMHHSEVKRGNHIVRRFTPEEDQLITRMDMRGASLAEMSRATGRRHNSIRGRLMTLARHEDRKESRVTA